MKQLIWIFTALLCAIYICQPVSDPDLWWHIVVGRWIVAHRTVPHVDLWNMFSGGQVWRAYSWLAEILLALVEREWHEQGLLGLEVVFACVVAFSFFYACGRIAGDPFIGALLGAYATVACFNNFTLRPQCLVWALFAWCLVIANNVAERGITRARLVLLAILGCLWANVHLTAIFGLIASFLWSVQDSSHRVSFKRGTIAAGAFLLGTFATPYLGGEWITFFAKSAHPVRYDSILEFKPATIYQHASVFVVLFVVLLSIVFWARRVLPATSRLLLALATTMAFLSAVKFLPFAVLTMCALFAGTWRTTEGMQNDRLTDGLLILKRGFLSLQHNTLRALGVFLLGALVLRTAILLKKPALAVNSIPRQAVDFMEARQLGFPVLNPFGTGGYLMYRFSNPNTGEPIHQVPIDGRTNVNSPVVWDLYDACFRGKVTWMDYIEKVNPETILWYFGSPLTALLDLSPDWCRVYTSGSTDESFVLFIKRQLFDQRRTEFSSPDCN